MPRFETRREQEVERALHAHGAVDEVGDERAVARSQSPSCAAARGSRMCANAPSSMRSSASSATWRDDCGGGRTRLTRSRRARRRAAPAATRPRHRALALGLHLVEREHAVGGAEHRVGVDRADGTVARRASRRLVRAPHLHAPAADREPRARSRVPGAHDAGQLGAGRAGSSAELVDGELLRVRRLADAAARAIDVGTARQVRREQLGAGVDEPGAQLTRGLVGGSIAHAHPRETPDRCRGPLRSA